MNPMAMGVAAAVASSFLGGTSVAATRFIIGAADPILLGVLRFGIGALCLLPLIRVGGGPLPARRDLPAILGLGVLFFAAFPWFFNASLALATAARGSLALSTLPLLTLVESPVLLAMVLSSLALFAVGGILATPDIPLIAGWMLALAGVSRMGDSRHPWRWALLAGLGGGLAALGKYTAWGFWPFAIGAALTLPKPQRTSRTFAVLLAALVALGTSAPNLLWNADHDYVSV